MTIVHRRQKPRFNYMRPYQRHHNYLVYGHGAYRSDLRRRRLARWRVNNSRPMIRGHGGYFTELVKKAGTYIDDIVRPVVQRVQGVITPAQSSYLVPTTYRTSQQIADNIIDTSVQKALSDQFIKANRGAVTVYPTRPWTRQLPRVISKQMHFPPSNRTIKYPMVNRSYLPPPKDVLKLPKTIVVSKAAPRVKFRGTPGMTFGMRKRINMNIGGEGRKFKVYPKYRFPSKLSDDAISTDSRFRWKTSRLGLPSPLGDDYQSSLMRDLQWTGHMLSSYGSSVGHRLAARVMKYLSYPGYEGGVLGLPILYWKRLRNRLKAVGFNFKQALEVLVEDPKYLDAAYKAIRIVGPVAAASATAAGIIVGTRERKKDREVIHQLLPKKRVQRKKRVFKRRNNRKRRSYRRS